MTPDQLLDRLAAVRIDRSHGGRAPHKPLMLLLALARVGLGPESRLIPYETADARFKELWEDCRRLHTALQYSQSSLRPRMSGCSFMDLITHTCVIRRNPVLVLLPPQLVLESGR